MTWGCARTVASWGPVECAAVGWLDVRPGLAAARVSRGRRHHWVTVRRAVLPGRVRERVLAAVAADPGLREEVLLGRAPAALAEAFGRVELFPADPAGIDLSCSCPARECAHGLEVVAAMARAFDTDPYLLLAWCGLERWELLRRLSRGALAVRVAPPPDSASAFWERADPLPPCPVWAGDPGGHRPAGAGTEPWAAAQAFLRGAPANAFCDGRNPATDGDPPPEKATRAIRAGDEPT
ncbi:MULTISPECIES: hypothetical protein [unclassified Nocardiopsis]|uniref:hypothetical protein n=1 Tax=Nocardiopsis TaxID=2013 RepID=UPI00387B95BD